jgi:hypothetical protein
VNISGAEMKIARWIALECHQVGSRIKKLHQRIKYKKSKRKVAGVPRVAEADCDVNVLNVANTFFTRRRVLFRATRRRSRVTRADRRVVRGGGGLHVTGQRARSRSRSVRRAKGSDLSDRVTGLVPRKVAACPTDRSSTRLS